MIKTIQWKIVGLTLLSISSEEIAYPLTQRLPISVERLTKSSDLSKFDFLSIWFEVSEKFRDLICFYPIFDIYCKDCIYGVYKQNYIIKYRKK